jgi:hypothetical protein
LCGELLKADFVVSEQNLSEWKAGGYREWQAHQQALERASDLASSASELNETAGAMADHLAVVLTARYVAALAEWDGDPEAVVGRKLRVLRALCQDVVELRRGDHSAARLKIEQARLEGEREETEEEVVEHFRRWAQNPKVREAICGKCTSPEEREQRLRHIFGLNTTEAAQQPEGGSNGAASEPPASQPGSNPIQLDQTP